MAETIFYALGLLILVYFFFWALITGRRGGRLDSPFSAEDWRSFHRRYGDKPPF